MVYVLNKMFILTIDQCVVCKKKSNKPCTQRNKILTPCILSREKSADDRFVILLCLYYSIIIEGRRTPVKIVK